jgi:predicted AlkP superfamily pyrophosphatase or phosphodiesterase
MRPFPLALFSLLLVVQSSSPMAAQGESHVAMISIDGLGASELFSTPTCVRENSTLRELARRGAYSRGVYSVLPAITYPAHATLATGSPPTTHRVLDNGRGGEWFKERSNIAVDTIWDAARRAGRSVAIVTWPSTYGAKADWLVPEDLDNAKDPVPALRAGSTPELFDALLAATGGAPSLMPFSEREAGKPLDEMTARFAAEVVRRHRPALLLAHFLDYDHRMHADPWSVEACAALERIDAHVKRIVEAYREAGILERTTFFVVSDHGFVAVKKRVSPFMLLKEAGWAEVFPGVDVATAFKYNPAGGSIAFHPGPATQPDWTQRLEKRIRPRVERRFGNLLRWIDPAQARSLGGFPDALFTLCARPGYAFTLQPEREVVVERAAAAGVHGYCPDEPEMNAVFVASGHGIRPAGAIGRMPMVDVGPTVASFLGVSLPQATGHDRSEAIRSFPERSSGR